MGVDLNLLPVCIEGAFSHEIIELQRRRELWPVIERIEADHGRDVPLNFVTFLSRVGSGDAHYGPTNTTPYDGRLKMVQAMHLKPLRDNPAVTDNWKNRAAWAWLGEAPDDLWIALYWH